MGSLHVLVVNCTDLRDTEYFSRQDPYVCFDYGSTNFKTKIHTDGGTNPIFGDKFDVPLDPNVTELQCTVWNSNVFVKDSFIGRGTIPLGKALASGLDDIRFPLQDEHGNGAGFITLILRVTHIGGKGAQTVSQASSASGAAWNCIPSSSVSRASSTSGAALNLSGSPSSQFTVAAASRSSSWSVLPSDDYPTTGQTMHGGYPPTGDSLYPLGLPGPGAVGGQKYPGFGLGFG